MYITHIYPKYRYPHFSLYNRYTIRQRCGSCPSAPFARVEHPRMSSDFLVICQLRKLALKVAWKQVHYQAAVRQLPEHSVHANQNVLDPNRPFQPDC